ncbi:hypothetical protein ACQKII_23625 [Lysinibacillus sp. NPDC048646]|uniref:hypothetical protein n=1 Tax=Lysinibacillus sp. NPDC048646 TaxID=3390574 RepID=UPI003D00C2C5
MDSRNKKPQYGIEATMPKAVGGNSDPVHAHVQIRASREVRINKIKNELIVVQNLIDKVYVTLSKRCFTGC